MAAPDPRVSGAKPIAKRFQGVEMCEHARLPGKGENTMICVRGAKYGFSAWLEAPGNAFKPPLSVSARTPTQAFKQARKALRRVRRSSR